MQYNKSSNPALHTIEKVVYTPTREALMTIEGTYNKTMLLMLLVLVTGYLGWNMARTVAVMPLFYVTLIGGIGIAIILAFKPLWAPILAPIYALLEGFFLGVISVIFENMYSGIVFQAILLTIIVAFLMNVLYRNKIIKVTKKFSAILIVATFSIFGVYMVSILMNVFTGSGIPLIHESGPVGIIFSLVVVFIASLNLLLDYHFIEESTKKKLPKAMEWFGAFALIVTLLWLYLELLKLLAKLRDN